MILWTLPSIYIGLILFLFYKFLQITWIGNMFVIYIWYVRNANQFLKWLNFFVVSLVMHEYTVFSTSLTRLCYTFWFTVTLVIRYIQDVQCGDCVPLCNDDYNLIHASVIICVPHRNKNFPLVPETLYLLFNSCPSSPTPRYWQSSFPPLILWL